MIRIFLTTLLAGFCVPGFLLSQVPHIEGHVTISRTAGTISCDLTLTRLPEAADYTLWLNSGLNIEMLDNAAEPLRRYVPDRYYNPDESYEAFQYVIRNQSGKMPLPPSLHIKYTGKFPVYDSIANMYDWEDWMGNMAFNGSTLRASDQSAWYPILYDVSLKKAYKAVTYNLTVRCADCTSLYLSGAAPAPGPEATLQATSPVHLLLFAGAYAFVEKDHLFFLNTPLSPAQISSLNAHKDRIVAYYEQQTGIPYGSALTFVATRASALKPGFSFVSYPTITFVGNNEGTWDITTLFDKTTAQFVPDQIPFLAHELAHYYVGTLYKPSGTLYWLFNEGLTEYLASAYVQHNQPDTAYKRLLTRYKAQTREIITFVPPGEVKQAADIAFDLYRYQYVPLLLTAIRHRVGEKIMWQWIRHILTDPAPAADYPYLLRSMKAAGITDQDIRYIDQMWLTGAGARDNLLQYLNQYP
ncbi:MAG: hypothetical protein SF053_15595 [Bacteroidia bacterium]|nr:hypothetical protein [Bacteroidia bacterium]